MVLGFGDIGFRVWGLGFGVQGSGFGFRLTGQLFVLWTNPHIFPSRPEELDIW